MEDTDRGEEGGGAGGQSKTPHTFYEQISRLRSLSDQRTEHVRERTGGLKRPGKSILWGKKSYDRKEQKTLRKYLT